MRWNFQQILMSYINGIKRMIDCRAMRPSRLNPWTAPPGIIHRLERGHCRIASPGRIYFPSSTNHIYPNNRLKCWLPLISLTSTATLEVEVVLDVESVRCAICGSPESRCSSGVGVCLACIRRHPEEAIAQSAQRHAKSRAAFHLPPSSPRGGAVPCGLCVQDCRLSEGEFGYCGMRSVHDGRLIHHAGSPKRGLLHWYRDPLPTNCVADWICQGHNQRGYHNLAVFYGSCTLDCAFCQNWHYRLTRPEAVQTDSIVEMTAEALAVRANPRTYCVCFFGGDPSSQMPHALAAAKSLAKRGITVCWETAGTMNPRFLKRAMELSLESGGCVKFDLKAFDEALHIALTGATNARTLENFQLAGELCCGREERPPLVASTLLVPGYVDAEEVYRIAGFIFGVDPSIPYALLAFHPSFEMSDLPCTSKTHAKAALHAAQEAGLTNVRLGNTHLLGWAV